MSYHIQNDNRSQEFEHYKGQDLPWTLYDGTLGHGFYATREEAEAEFENVKIEAREDVARLAMELEEAEDLLEELESQQI